MERISELLDEAVQWPLNSDYGTTAIARWAIEATNRIQELQWTVGNQRESIEHLRGQINHLSAVIDNIEGRLIEGGTL